MNEKRKCAGTTSKGKACKQIVKGLNLYCKDHRPFIQKLKKHIRKNWLPYALFLLSIGLGIYIWKDSQAQSTKDFSIVGEKVTKVEESVDSRNKKIDDIAKVVVDEKDIEYLDEK